MKKLKHIALVQKGKVPKEFVYSDPNDDLPIYLAMDYLRNKPKRLSFVPNSEKYINVDEDEILLLWDGSNAGEFLRSKKGVLSSTMAVIRVKDGIDKQFIYYQFKNFERYLKDITVGMGIPHVNPQELLNFSFLIPSLEHQAVIANYLDQKTAEIDQLISQKEELLQFYDEEKTAIINQAVTKGLNPNVKLKDSGVDWLGAIPVHWEVKRMRYFTKIKTGSKDTENRENYAEFPFYVRSQTIERISSYSFDGEAILTAGDGVGVGKVFHYVNGKFDYHQRVYKVSDFIGVEGKLLFYYMKLNFHKEVMRISAKSTVDSLRLPMLQNFPVCIPSKQEQTQIVNHIETETKKINTKIANTKKSIALLKEYKTALISEVVTGKIKI